MGFFEFVGFGILFVVATVVFLALGFWGACTKKPIALLFGLLGMGVALIIQYPDGNSPLAIAGVVMIGGAILAGIMGSIQAKGFRARFLMGMALVTLATGCFFTFFGMIEIVPAEAETSRRILEILAWSIVAPVGIMGILEFLWDPFGVCHCKTATAK